MCGRFNLITDAGALVDFFQLGQAMALQPRYNIAPSQDIVVVRETGGGRRPSMLRWGLIPSWAKDLKIGYRMINARAETVAEKPSFRVALRRRRCLIPATGFYEWKAAPGGKQPYNILLGNGGLFAFAGLWERWQGEAGEVVESCTIIVTRANGAISPIHDRMPVILDPSDYKSWLDPGLHDPALLQLLLRPCPAGWINSYPVNRLVGNPKNDGPECVEPLGRK